MYHFVSIRDCIAMFRYVRSMLVPLTMPLAVIVGLPLLAVTRSRRRTVNFCSALWADMTCALIGLQVDVSGAEHLESPRPAMFLLNHQSNADGSLVGKLPRRDVTYLSKKELSRQWPIRSWLMRQGGQILVDRDDPAGAGKAMQALIAAVRNDGVSAVIFPEGQRSQSTTLLPFKKGAFPSPLRAKVPVIPTVIHNSIDAQPRGEELYRPAIVRVTVLQPIDTSTWRVRSLDQHMAEVRSMYLREL
jgi:putative phosphoserine phosphatase/1-acylglycerol-3-phosphate O-acyltransferase